MQCPFSLYLILNHCVCVSFLEPGYEFDKASLLQYNHMSFGGPPVTVHTVEEEDELTRHDNNQSDIGQSFFTLNSGTICLYWVTLILLFNQRELMCFPQSILYGAM